MIDMAEKFERSDMKRKIKSMLGSMPREKYIQSTVDDMCLPGRTIDFIEGGRYFIATYQGRKRIYIIDGICGLPPSNDDLSTMIGILRYCRDRVVVGVRK